jgi:hypothetical protein
VAFNFTTRTPVEIRITSVKVISLPGFPAPKVIGVVISPHFSTIAGVTGWPVRIPKGTTTQEGGHVRLARALGRTVLLGRTNALWIGVRVPSLHHAYAVEDVRINYVLRGIAHTMTINQSTAPDVICASSSDNKLRAPAWCSRAMLDADWVATVLKVDHDTTGRIADEANSVTQLAINEVESSGYGVPSLAQVRFLANRLFPATSTDGILSVTAVQSGAVPEWRFVIRDTASNSTLVRCASRGRVTRFGTSDAISGGGVMACPSPT